MKKYIILFVCIILLGVGFLAFSNKFSHKPNKDALKLFGFNTNSESPYKNGIQKTESNKDTISDSEIPNKELEDNGAVSEGAAASQNNIYFENMNVLYGPFKLYQIDQVKKKLQKFIFQYLSPNVQQATVVVEDPENTPQDYNFTVKIEGFKDMEVKLSLDPKTNVVSTTIIQVD